MIKAIDFAFELHTIRFWYDDVDYIVHVVHSMARSDFLDFLVDVVAIR